MEKNNENKLDNEQILDSEITETKIYTNLDKILHIELHKTMTPEQIDQMIQNFDANEAFEKFVKVYEELKFCNVSEPGKKTQIKNALNYVFSKFLKSYVNEQNLNESLAFINTVTKIFTQYISEHKND